MDGNGWKWMGMDGNGVIIDSDYGIFPHSLLSTSKYKYKKWDSFALYIFL
jgi:hypothetical protein